MFSSYAKGSQGCPLLSNIEQIFKKLIYNRVKTFFTKNNLIYPLQYGFGRLHSTFHALISLTEQIGENVDKGNKYRLWYFCWFAKSFDTVEHVILLAQLEHYDKRSISNEWYKSVLFAPDNLFPSMLVFLIQLL